MLLNECFDVEASFVDLKVSHVRDGQSNLIGQKIWFFRPYQTDQAQQFALCHIGSLRLDCTISLSW